MNYGLPYQGNKSRIAERLGKCLPPANTFVDLFCGGCAMTHWAMLSGKYRNYLCNDINPMLPQAFLDAANGKFRNEDRWISRAEFNRLKNTDPYAALCYSYANNMTDYCYSEKREPYERALHSMVCFHDFTEWEKLDPRSAPLLKQVLGNISDTRMRRLAAAEILRQMHGSNPLYGCEAGHMQQAMSNVTRLNNIEYLERAQSMHGFHINTSTVTVSSKDYREVAIPDNSIIYCDPPYVGKRDYKYLRGMQFDYDAFYDWCEQQTQPVFISEYSMPEDRFECVAEIQIKRKMDVRKHTMCDEKLWRPKRQIARLRLYPGSIKV